MLDAQVTLGIGQLAAWPYKVYISLVPEYILKVDVLQRLWLCTTVGEFQLHVQVVNWWYGASIPPSSYVF
jgi:hypothetical protein